MTFIAFSGSQEQCFEANSAPDNFAEFLQEYFITIVDADPSVRIGDPDTTTIRIRDDDGQCSQCVVRHRQNTKWIVSREYLVHMNTSCVCH